MDILSLNIPPGKNIFCLYSTLITYGITVWGQANKNVRAGGVSTWMGDHLQQKPCCGGLILSPIFLASTILFR